MSKYVLFREEKNDDVIREFKVMVPSVGEPGFYREGLSIDAFCRHWRSHIYAKHTDKIPLPDHMFFCRYSKELELEESIGPPLTVPFLTHKVPTITLSNVWEFYEYIGWDYKRKCFVDRQ